jgi:hypothetical protein
MLSLSDCLLFYIMFLSLYLCCPSLPLPLSLSASLFLLFPLSYSEFISPYVSSAFLSLSQVPFLFSLPLLLFFSLFLPLPSPPPISFKPRLMFSVLKSNLGLPFYLCPFQTFVLINYQSVFLSYFPHLFFLKILFNNTNPRECVMKHFTAVINSFL